MWNFYEQDVRRLRRALGDVERTPEFKRIQSVMLVAMGQSPMQAAQSTAQSRWNVYKSIGKYLRRHHPEDLLDRPKSGRPKTASHLSPGRIGRELKRDPLRLGYLATEWTVPLLVEHLYRRYHCRISHRTLRRRLKSMNLAWKRPRHAYYRDPHRAQKKGLWSGEFVGF